MTRSDAAMHWTAGSIALAGLVAMTVFSGYAAAINVGLFRVICVGAALYLGREALRLGRDMLRELRGQALRPR